MLIGAVPGSIDADPGKAAYQKLVRGQFSLGHKSAQGLGEIMMSVGKIKDINLPADITRLPTEKGIQDAHLRARRRRGLHVTNLVKCHAWTSWEQDYNPTWRQAGDACERRHLSEEIAVVDPSMVVLLGKEVADYLSKSESWGMEGVKISDWAEHADYRQLHGKNRFVTAWIHPGGRFFWIQGRKYWNSYAKQIAEFVA